MTWSLLVRNLHHQKVNLFYITNSYQMYPTKRFNRLLKALRGIFREGKFEQESVKNHCVRYFLKYSNLCHITLLSFKPAFKKGLYCYVKFPLP